jgi:hypothetical protein
VKADGMASIVAYARSLQQLLQLAGLPTVLDDSCHSTPGKLRWCQGEGLEGGMSGP